MGPSCMGRGRNAGNLVVTAHVYIGVFLELGLPTKHHHLVKLWENILWLGCLVRDWSVIGVDVWW